MFIDLFDVETIVPSWVLLRAKKEAPSSPQHTPWWNSAGPAKTQTWAKDTHAAADLLQRADASTRAFVEAVVARRQFYRTHGWVLGGPTLCVAADSFAATQSVGPPRATPRPQNLKNTKHSAAESPESKFPLQQFTGTRNGASPPTLSVKWCLRSHPALPALPRSASPARPAASPCDENSPPPSIVIRSLHPRANRRTASARSPVPRAAEFTITLFAPLSGKNSPLERPGSRTSSRAAHRTRATPFAAGKAGHHHSDAHSPTSPPRASTNNRKSSCAHCCWRASSRLPVRPLPGRYRAAPDRARCQRAPRSPDAPSSRKRRVSLASPAGPHRDSPRSGRLFG